MKKLIVCWLTLYFFSCQKNINLNLPQPPPQVVVEGHIQPNQLAWVLLSRNFNYFGTTSITSIVATDLVHGAKIAISNGTSTDSMREVIPTLGYYQSATMKGVTGATYDLTIVTGGETLTATTSILPPIPLDSAWFQLEPTYALYGYLWAILYDPPPCGHYYRWMAKRINLDTTFIAPYESAFNDEFICGQKFEFFYGRGNVPGSTAPDDTGSTRQFFKAGNTVVVEFCTISEAAYQFYYTYYYQLNNVGNPFGSPAPVLGNINGGLGIWCGYGTSFDTILCKL